MTPIRLLQWFATALLAGAWWYDAGPTVTAIHSVGVILTVCTEIIIHEFRHQKAKETAND